MTLYVLDIFIKVCIVISFGNLDTSRSPACRKRRLIWAVCRNHRIKRLVPCQCLDGHVKEPYEMSMALGARRSNFFSPPEHLCAVTYMTEISLIVTLNNQFNSTQLPIHSKHISTVNARNFTYTYNWFSLNIYGSPTVGQPLSHCLHTLI